MIALPDLSQPVNAAALSRLIARLEGYPILAVEAKRDSEGLLIVHAWHDMKERPLYIAVVGDVINATVLIEVYEQLHSFVERDWDDLIGFPPIYGIACKSMAKAAQAMIAVGQQNPDKDWDTFEWVWVWQPEREPDGRINTVRTLGDSGGAAIEEV